MAPATGDRRRSDRRAGPDRVVVSLVDHPQRVGPHRRVARRDAVESLVASASASQAPNLAAPDGHTWMPSRLRSGVPSPFRSMHARFMPHTTLASSTAMLRSLPSWASSAATANRRACSAFRSLSQVGRRRHHDQLRAERLQFLGQTRSAPLDTASESAVASQFEIWTSARSDADLGRTLRESASTGRCRIARARSAGTRDTPRGRRPRGRRRSTMRSTAGARS